MASRSDFDDDPMESGPNQNAVVTMYTHRLVPSTQVAASLDHFVRAQQQRLRDRNTKRFRGFHVDHQLELGWLLDREISGLGALQYLFDVVCSQHVVIEEYR